MNSKYKLLRTKFQGKKVLITGGLGMIGSTIAHKLVEFGADVTLLDACIKPFGANFFSIEGIKDKIKINISDIRDRESIKYLVAGKDIIFNLAGQVSHNDSLNNPFLDADINYLGHLNVLEAVRNYSPKAKILFPGSRLQFGENLYLFYNRVYNISTVVFRIANPYGPRAQMHHSKYCIINWFLRLAMENKPIKIFGDGSQIRDYIYIDNLADAFILAAENERTSGEVFNVGSGVGTKFKEMAQLIVETIKSGKIEYVPWPKNYLNVETGNYVTDITKIIKVLGWKPRTTLAEGIALTFDYYKRYRNFYWN